LTNSPGMQQTTTFTPEAKTVDGITFDHIQTKFTITGRNPQERQAAQFINMLYGTNGLDGYAGVVDPQHHVTVFGGNDALLSSTITAVKANSDTLGALPGVKAVTANLPPDRFMEMYIPVDNLVATGVAFAKQMGMPVNLP